MSELGPGGKIEAGIPFWMHPEVVEDVRTMFPEEYLANAAFMGYFREMSERIRRIIDDLSTKMNFKPIYDKEKKA